MTRSWTASELLTSHTVAEPIVAGGVRCHGGLDATGTYVSPRTKYRVPAIEAWKAAHRADFGTDILDAPIATWPEPYPNVAQTKYLLAEGVREPMITALTRIGTVEGFGGMIRHVAPADDLQAFFDDSIEGTCTQHLTLGLFEAQARDEAGWGDEGGHREMWFAARDLAFECPATADETQTMLERMGIPVAAAEPAGRATPPAATGPEPMFPELDIGLEAMLRRMISLLFIEVSAFHTFAWAEDVLADRELVAGDGEAARLVSYIRADETPHVEYLKTALTEMRDRTFVTLAGERLEGVDVIGRLWKTHLADSLGARRDLAMRTFLAELDHAVAGNARRDEILEGFHAAGAVHPDRRPQ